jgi:Fe-S-cluster formation regulator IscX/YfhJ
MTKKVGELLAVTFWTKVDRIDGAEKILVEEEITIAKTPEPSPSCAILLERASKETITFDEAQQVINCFNRYFDKDKTQVLVKDKDPKTINFEDLAKWSLEVSNDIETDKTTKLGKIIIENKKTLLEVKADVLKLETKE